MNEQATLDAGGAPNEWGFSEYLFQGIIPSYIDYTAARNPAPQLTQAQLETAYRIPEQRGTAEDDAAEFIFGNVGGKTIGLSLGGLAAAAVGLYLIWNR